MIYQLELWCLIVFSAVSSGEQTGPSLSYFTPNPHPNCYTSGYVNPPRFCGVPAVQQPNFHTVVEANPLLAALFLSSTLHLHPKIPGYNHLEHLPLNPYLALLLSHYGKYQPVFGKGGGLYGYVAANNYHNNKPFGAYKIYEDNDG
ncbi:uncharacterized protein LOC123010006 [Tribolium madens]|uniref:uncharacterized protein LOC123010006 n=1 Tax=Tribolium madens TaxID=41895 RepID=UPI001CF7611A|nr:uncharacterized protein LOC123010006 [Tribolium madens]